MSTTPTENTNVSETPIFDPFPEPSGYPSGWDLSGITPNPVSDLAAPVIESTED